MKGFVAFGATTIEVGVIMKPGKVISPGFIYGNVSYKCLFEVCINISYNLVVVYYQLYILF